MEGLDLSIGLYMVKEKAKPVFTEFLLLHIRSHLFNSVGTRILNVIQANVRQHGLHNIKLLTECMSRTSGQFQSLYIFGLR